jgi:hypothetical protein
VLLLRSLGTVIGPLLEGPDTLHADRDGFEEESLLGVGYVQTSEYLTHREHRGFSSSHCQLVQRLFLQRK